MMKAFDIIQCFDGKKILKMPTFTPDCHGLCYKIVRNQNSDFHSDIM